AARARRAGGWRGRLRTASSPASADGSQSELRLRGGAGTRRPRPRWADGGRRSDDVVVWGCRIGQVEDVAGRLRRERGGAEGGDAVQRAARGWSADICQRDVEGDHSRGRAV